MLAASGYREITVAELDADDIAEDVAAARIARSPRRLAACASVAPSPGAPISMPKRTASPASMPRRVEAVNAIDEAITLATLPPYRARGPAPDAGHRQNHSLRSARQGRRGGGATAWQATPAIAVAPFVTKRVALISTQFADTRPQILDKNRSAIDARVEPLGSSVVHEARVRHDTGELAEAIRAARTMDADPILIFGASAITDRRDVVPAAIVAAGGEITHFGMPVDPGNLLLLGKLGNADRGRPARLRALAQGERLRFRARKRCWPNVPVGRAEIAAMGVGGLLSEIHTRPQPRDRQPVGPHAPRIAAVILAAGLSSRMGHNKLVADVGGKPLVRARRGCGARKRRASGDRGDRKRGRERRSGALRDCPSRWSEISTSERV